MPSFDTIANSYERLEKMTFAGNLQKARCFCLEFIRTPRRALLIGDGDGRFSSELLRRIPYLEVDSIDISPRMLELAKKRAGNSGDRLNTIEVDAIQFAYPINSYDFIGLHFCLDCFTQEAIENLLPKLESALADGGFVAYSDFQSKTIWQQLLVTFLYLNFRVFTGLKANRLPKVQWSSEIKTVASYHSLGDLVFSQILQKTSR